MKFMVDFLFWVVLFIVELVCMVLCRLVMFSEMCMVMV